MRGLESKYRRSMLWNERKKERENEFIRPTKNINKKN